MKVLHTLTIQYILRNYCFDFILQTWLSLKLFAGLILATVLSLAFILFTLLINIIWNIINSNYVIKIIPLHNRIHTSEWKREMNMQVFINSALCSSSISKIFQDVIYIMPFFRFIMALHLLLIGKHFLPTQTSVASIHVSQVASHINPTLSMTRNENSDSRTSWGTERGRRKRAMYRAELTVTVVFSWTWCTNSFWHARLSGRVVNVVETRKSILRSVYFSHRSSPAAALFHWVVICCQSF